MSSDDDDDRNLLADMGQEIHVLSCTWNTQKASQECREVCGDLYGK
jgi:hypothetical protein